jgi:hypothetical protein
MSLREPTTTATHDNAAGRILLVALQRAPGNSGTENLHRGVNRVDLLSDHVLLGLQRFDSCQLLLNLPTTLRQHLQSSRQVFMSACVEHGRASLAVASGHRDCTSITVL